MMARATPCTCSTRITKRAAGHDRVRVSPCRRGAGRGRHVARQQRRRPGHRLPATARRRCRNHVLRGRIDLRRWLAARDSAERGGYDMTDDLRRGLAAIIPPGTADARFLHLTVSSASYDADQTFIIPNNDRALRAIQLLS